MRFEYVEGTSNKFWEVIVKGAQLTTRWGRIGGSVNQRVADLASAEAAIKERDKMIREKTGKGYREVTNGKAKAAPPKAAPKPVASNVKVSELVATSMQDPAGYNRISRIAFDDKRVFMCGERAVATSDGKTLHPRISPGEVFALYYFDGALYACGSNGLHVSRDFGETWNEIAMPKVTYRFVIMRDSQGTWWMGCDSGIVLTSKKLESSWKKAGFKGKDRMLHVVEIDGKLLWAGPGSGAWDGKSYKPLKGVDKKHVLTRIIELPSGVLVAIGDNAVAYRSTDRGASWKAVKVPVKDEDLEDCAIVAGALIVVGGGGVILKSTNDGQSFTKIKSPSQYKLWGIGSWGDGAFLAGDRGMIVKLASPKDQFWKGAKDVLAPPPPSIDEDFTPHAPTKNRDEAFKRQLADAVKAYKPTEDKRPPDPNPELARLVDADAEGSTDALDVYADWLQGQGDPRGELAAIQLKLAESPKDKTLAKVEKQLLKTHADALLGPFKGLDDVVTLTWRGGFIESARIANSIDRDPDYGDGDEESAVDIEKLFGQLLDHPSARFLRDLTVGLVSFEDNSYDTIAKTIGKRHLPALRSLYLGDFSYEETELSWSSLGNIQPIYPALPNLRRLHVRSGSGNLGKIVHPTLEHFEITTGGLDPKQAKAIGTAVWPSLTSLSLMVGRERYGGTTTLKDLKPILAGENLPRLRHLGLKNLEFTDNLIDALATSKILPQLETLDIGMGTLSGDGVRRLYRYQKAFRHLAKLDVSQSFLRKDDLKLLRTLKIPLDDSDQRDDGGDPSDRYAAVGE